jgi:hypothetical protein
MKEKIKEEFVELEHAVCHNPCKICNSEGYLSNREMCPVCAQVVEIKSTVSLPGGLVVNLS